MDDPTLISIWASGVWMELGNPTSTTPSTISGYAVQNSTLGRLNSLLGTCFSGSGYTGIGTLNYQIGPWITNTELALIGSMYMVSYYRNIAQSVMGVSSTSIPWTTIKEADTTITRANGINMGQVYLNEAKEAQQQLVYLINAYRQNSEGGNQARTVDYYDLVSAPYTQYNWP